MSPYVWIPSRPHIDEHDGEGLPKEEEVDEEGKGDHGECPKEKHHDKVGRLSPKTSFFQHPAAHQG